MAVGNCFMTWLLYVCIHILLCINTVGTSICAVKRLSVSGEKKNSLKSFVCLELRFDLKWVQLVIGLIKIVAPYCVSNNMNKQKPKTKKKWGEKQNTDSETEVKHKWKRTIYVVECNLFVVGSYNKSICLIYDLHFQHPNTPQHLNASPFHLSVFIRLKCVHQLSNLKSVQPQRFFIGIGMGHNINHMENENGVK